MRTFVSVVGARPQFIKLAALSRALDALAAGGASVTHRIVHTGQHYDRDMSQVFFSEMEIPRPHVDLGIRAARHGEMTGRMLEGLERTLLAERPDVVIVYGDTNSTLAAALAAAKLELPVAHVEAGLRSFNRRMPEEINRVLTDHLATWRLCPTTASVENLRREGVADATIHQVGDVTLDSALHYGDRPEVAETCREILRRHPRGFYLATVHRAANTDEAPRLREIVAALTTLASTVPVVMPLHPRTRDALDRLGVSSAGIETIGPASYLRMLGLLRGCRAVLTDSGGLQKEAYFFGKPCVVLRDETEWPELIEAGGHRLTGADAARTLDAVRALEARGSPPEARAALYGNGDAARRIAALLAEAGAA